jgi:hypothetical protein
VKTEEIINGVTVEIIRNETAQPMKIEPRAWTLPPGMAFVYAWIRNQTPREGSWRIIEDVAICPIAEIQYSTDFCLRAIDAALRQVKAAA